MAPAEIGAHFTSGRLCVEFPFTGATGCQRALHRIWLLLESCSLHFSCTGRLCCWKALWCTSRHFHFTPLPKAVSWADLPFTCCGPGPAFHFSKPLKKNVIFSCVRAEVWLDRQAVLAQCRTGLCVCVCVYYGTQLSTQLGIQLVFIICNLFFSLLSHNDIVEA